MLHLKLKEGENVAIGPDIRLNCERSLQGELRLAIQAPPTIVVTMNLNKYYIGPEIVVTHERGADKCIDIGVEAPRSVHIHRSDAKKVAK